MIALIAPQTPPFFKKNKMAYNEFRPTNEQLLLLGFIQVDDGREHPYNTFWELYMNDNCVLTMDAFWDFHLTINDKSSGGDIYLRFNGMEMLELFVRHLKK